MINSNSVLDAAQVFVILELTLSKGHGKEREAIAIPLVAVWEEVQHPAGKRRMKGKGDGEEKSLRRCCRRAGSCCWMSPASHQWHKQSLLVGGRYLELNIHR